MFGLEVVFGLCLATTRTRSGRRREHEINGKLLLVLGIVDDLKVGVDDVGLLLGLLGCGLAFG